MNSATRRQFLQGSAASTAVAAAADAAAYRKPGHPTIDCQSHLFVPELIEMMAKRKDLPYSYKKDGNTYVVTGPPGEWHRRLRAKHMDVEAKLADMDEAGIDRTMISINDPGPEVFGDDSPAAARVCNDWIADVSRRHPKRFSGLAVLPLLNMNESLKELDRCVNKLGMKGILLYSNLAEKFPDEAEFRELFAEAERLDMPVLLHPAHPVTFDETKGHSMMAGLGLMFDTTIALARIILAGVLDEYPKLKLVCPHVGGTLPYLVGRIDHQTQILKRGAEHITKPPSEYLRHIYLDAVSPIAMAIQYGIDYVGADRMLYSSDHPWVDPKMIATHLQSLGLSSEDEAKIFGGNATKLFNL